MREDLEAQMTHKKNMDDRRNQRNRQFETGIIQRDNFEAEKALTNNIAERKTVKNYLNNAY
jgi:hypothetical protein